MRINLEKYQQDFTHLQSMRMEFFGITSAMQNWNQTEVTQDPHPHDGEEQAWLFNLKNMWGNTVTLFKQLLNSFKVFSGDPEGLKRIKESLYDAKDLDHFNFIANVKVPLPCADGFVGDHYAFCKLLKENISDICTLTLKELTEFNVFLAKLISSKDFRVSVKDSKKRILALEKWYTKKVEEYNQFFSDRATNQRLELGKMYDNKKQMLEACQIVIQAYEYALNGIYEELDGLVKEIAQKVDMAIEMEESDEKVKISKEVFMNLSEFTHMLAKMVELSSVYGTMVETAAVHSAYHLEQTHKLKK